MVPVARIGDSRASERRECFDTNLFSAITLVINVPYPRRLADIHQLEAILPSLRQARGRVLLTSTGAARHSYAAWGAYGASKAALKSLGDTLAVEEPDITTVSVEPGTVDTDMQKDIRETHLAKMDAEDRKRFLGLHEEGKLVRPEQPGNVIARLALSASKELSGQTFR